jgi:hypothetical protein
MLLTAWMRRAVKEGGGEMARVGGKVSVEACGDPKLTGRTAYLERRWLLDRFGLKSDMFGSRDDGSRLYQIPSSSASSTAWVDLRFKRLAMAR